MNTCRVPPRVTSQVTLRQYEHFTLSLFSAPAGYSDAMLVRCHSSSSLFKSEQDEPAASGSDKYATTIHCGGQRSTYQKNPGDKLRIHTLIITKCDV